MFNRSVIDNNPTNAAHTYKLGRGRSIGTATCTVIGTATQQGGPFVFDDGPTF